MSSKTMNPLQALGPSLFLQILSNFSLSSLQTCLTVSRSWNNLIINSTTTLYKPIAHEIGIEPPILDKLEAVERATAQTSSWSNPDEPPKATQANAEGSGSLSVNWKKAIKDHLNLQDNWKFGRAKSDWVHPGRNTVWRIKIDRDENTIVSSSRFDGILVSDLETSEPIFEFDGIGAYAHLEFVKGYLIFNSSDERSFEVHITPTALSKLSPERRKKLPSNRTSITRNTGYSFTHEGEHEPPSNDSTELPPRGHLTYYKSITPRTECFAFRARIDKEYTPLEKLVFGTSSDEEAYIYDLQSDSNREMERFVFDAEDRGRPNYIEFDDNFLFICHSFSVNVYSRATKRKIITFPPLVTAPFDAASAIYTCYNPSQATSKLKPTSFDQVLVGELQVEGKWIDDQGFDAVMMASGQGRIAGREFSAIHYTSKDLFATTRSGTIYVLRNYQECLSIQNPEERDKAVNANLLAIVLRDSLVNLSTYGEHVVATSPNSVYLLDTTSLPLPPYNTGPSSAPRPKIRLNSLLNVHHRGMAQCSCVQMDRDHLYAVYWALGDSESGGTLDYEGNRILPPPEVIGDFGLCVKVWDFSVEQ